MKESDLFHSSWEKLNNKEKNKLQYFIEDVKNKEKKLNVKILEEQYELAEQLSRDTGDEFRWEETIDGQRRLLRTSFRNEDAPFRYAIPQQIEVVEDEEPEEIENDSEIEPIKICTHDYDFDSILDCTSGKAYPDIVLITSWKCACGKKFWLNEGKSQQESRDVAWDAFMRHKFPESWDQAEKFDQVWEDCFPAPIKEKHISTNGPLPLWFYIITMISVFVLLGFTALRDFL